MSKLFYPRIPSRASYSALNLFKPTIGFTHKRQQKVYYWISVVGATSLGLFMILFAAMMVSKLFKSDAEWNTTVKKLRLWDKSPEIMLSEEDDISVRVTISKVGPHPFLDSLNLTEKIGVQAGLAHQTVAGVEVSDLNATYLDIQS